MATAALITRSTSYLTRSALSCIKTRISPKETVNSAVYPACVRYLSISPAYNMKLVQYSYKNNPEVRVGFLEGENVVEIHKIDPSLPATLLDILKKGDIEKVKKLKSTKDALIPLSTVNLEAPITGMDKVLCIGLNYKDHCEEQKLTPPAVPMIFSKFASCVIGPKGAVKLRRATQKVDWEVELVAVIGKTASDVKAKDAFDYIVGYTVAQDISARDWQKEKNGGQFLLGKAMDTFCPIGPCITTSDEIGDAQDLSIRCSVNGVLKQTSRTDKLVHRIEDVIERLTSVMTLLPGDIILTGTPGGVGMYRSPPEYLKAGDIVHSEIEKIGVLETRIAAVIGKTASDVKAKVMGYTVAQDISARDWQKEKNGGQFLLGKAMDTFCPIGPCITTSDEIGDPENLDQVLCCVNGELKQERKTNQLINTIPNVIERLTSVMTLLLGDIILTGTPGGVGIYRSPPEFLKAGDVMQSEVENIGVLITRIEHF